MRRSLLFSQSSLSCLLTLTSLRHLDHRAGLHRDSIRRDGRLCESVNVCCQSDCSAQTHRGVSQPRRKLLPVRVDTAATSKPPVDVFVSPVLHVAVLDVRSVSLMK